ncbi:hypothetical protein [Microbacterium sp. A93]|uniref:hypothetical protein n=1 Tax=Microbacterium sp. A93 TaxID=3450716 RepID=UPI003F41FB65
MADQWEPDRSGDGKQLESKDHARFQRREWRFVRVGWAVLALFIVAGLLGLFGNGPLSDNSTTSDSGHVSIDHQRIARNLADDTLVLRLSEETVQDDQITLRVTGSWVEDIDVSGIAPQPSTEYAIPGGVAYEFDVLEPGDLTATISFRATGYGSLDGRVAAGGDSVGFTQFVLP